MDKKYVELTWVKPGATPDGHQDSVILEQIDENNFLKKRGKIGVRFGRNKITSITLPMSEWNLELNRFLEKGYIIVPGKKAKSVKKEIKKTDSDFAPEKTEYEQYFVNYLRSMAKQAVAESFSITVEELTKEQIEQSKKILSSLMKNYEEMSLKDFNDALCHYYMTVPRRMSSLAEHLASGKDKLGHPLTEEQKVEEKKALVEKETSRFEALMQILSDEKMKSFKKSFTEAYEVGVSKPTDAEIEHYKHMMKEQSHKFIRAWNITNEKRDKMFEDFCRKNNLTRDNKGICELFHGSKGENWSSIWVGGLYTVPKNFFTGETPSICGKAYGMGIYTAPNAIKSMGYADTRSAKWNTGYASTGFLAICDVAVGPPDTRYKGDRGCDHSLNWEKLQQIKPGAFCTWAERAYSGFQMDEVIVYQDAQIRLKALIEFQG